MVFHTQERDFTRGGKSFFHTMSVTMGDGCDDVLVTGTLSNLPSQPTRTVTNFSKKVH